MIVGSSPIHHRVESAEAKYDMAQRHKPSASKNTARNLTKSHRIANTALFLLLVCADYVETVSILSS